MRRSSIRYLIVVNHKHRVRTVRRQLEIENSDSQIKCCHRWCVHTPAALSNSEMNAEGKRYGEERKKQTKTYFSILLHLLVIIYYALCYIGIVYVLLHSLTHSHTHFALSFCRLQDIFFYLFSFFFILSFFYFGARNFKIKRIWHIPYKRHKNRKTFQLHTRFVWHLLKHTHTHTYRGDEKCGAVFFFLL